MDSTRVSPSGISQDIYSIFIVYSLIYLFYLYLFIYFCLLNVVVVVLLWSASGTAVFMESVLVVAGLAAF
jgi:hypothetical protein